MATQKRRTTLPRVEKISGTLDDLAKKYKGVADLGGKALTPELVASQLTELAARVRSGGLPAVQAVAGTLDDLAKKYKSSAEFDFSRPVVETVAGTLDDLAKKYHGVDATRPDIDRKRNR